MSPRDWLDQAGPSYMPWVMVAVACAYIVAMLFGPWR